jgi:hypothetical protein
MAESSAISTAINTFASPGEAIQAIKESPRFLFPLALIVIAAGIVTFLYMSAVDLEWFFEQQLAQNPNVTEAQAAQTGQALGSLPPGALASLLSIFGALSTAIVMLVQALYFKITSLILKDGVVYKRWFSMVCWCTLPSCLGYLATAVNLLTSDVSLMPREKVNPLAFSNLLGLEPMGSGTLDQIVMNLDATTIWSAILMIMAYKAFTGKNLTTSAVVVTLPLLIVVSVAFAL